MNKISILIFCLFSNQTLLAMKSQPETKEVIPVMHPVHYAAQPSALLNLGQSCYFNAVVQCLAVCDTVNYTETNDLINAVRANRPLDEETLTEYFSQVTGAFFENNQGQQDAHELVTKLLDRLPSAERKKFELDIQSELTCTHCKTSRQQPAERILHRETKNEEQSTVLALSFDGQDQKKASVNFFELLDKYQQEEFLDGANKVYCDHKDCRKNTRTSKKLIFDLVSPQHLIVQFKRFDNVNGVFKKINTLVRLYPKVGVGAGRYKLMGIVYHKGTLNDGHYTAHVNYNNQWFYCDDHKIAPGTKPAFGFTPYLLFFTKISKHDTQAATLPDYIPDAPEHRAIPVAKVQTPAKKSSKDIPAHKKASHYKSKPLPSTLAHIKDSSKVIPFRDVVYCRCHGKTCDSADPTCIFDDNNDCDDQVYQIEDPDYNPEDEKRTYIQDEDNNYVCTFVLENGKKCGKLTKTKILLREHEHIHTGEKPFGCRFCGLLFTKSLHRKRHERTHPGEQNYTCKHCQRPFTTGEACTRHERTHHTDEKKYTCQYCPKSFGRSDNCNIHERTHTGEQNYTCKHCQRPFTTGEACTRHERTHTDGKKYTCQYCSKSFKRSDNCKMHERIHTGEKKYICQYCLKSFTQYSTRTNHERTHTGERPYECNEPGCDEKFRTNRKFDSHKKRHAEEKPYPCTYPGCKMRFTRSDDVGQHLNSHSDEKKFICEHCNKGFKFNSSRYLHQHGSSRQAIACPVLKNNGTGTYKNVF